MTVPVKKKTPRIMAIGAHPDDCDISIGGSAALWREAGCEVHFVSVTDGSRGHFREEYRAEPGRLIDRRLREAKAACAVIGARYHCLGVTDGEVEADLQTLKTMVRLIREIGPDLILCNRPGDYHRDHRYTARLLLDAAYMLTVPFFCGSSPCLHKTPVIAYWWDTFREGGAFRPDVTVAIDSIWAKKVQMVAEHESQVYEWLPYNMGTLEEVPEAEPARRAALDRWLRRRCDELMKRCGIAGQGPIEAFQISEYGAPLQGGDWTDLFPAMNV